VPAISATVVGGYAEIMGKENEKWKSGQNFVKQDSLSLLLADMPLWHGDIGSHMRAKAAYNKPASFIGSKRNIPGSGPLPNLDKVVLQNVGYASLK
jgi:hypothetical protein